MEFLCQIMNHELTYSWQWRSLCSNIMFVLAHLKSSSQNVGSWDTVRVFMAMLQLWVLGMSQSMIEDQAQRKSAVWSRIMLLNCFEGNFGKLRLIINVSFQLRHTLPLIISLSRMCSPLHSALFDINLLHSHLVFFGLNQWTLCTQIVISQDSAHLGAESWSRLATDSISIYTWSVCDNRC